MSKGIRAQEVGSERQIATTILSLRQLPAAPPFSPPLSHKRKKQRQVPGVVDRIVYVSAVSTNNHYVRTAAWSNIRDLFTTDAFQVNDSILNNEN